MRIWAKIFQDNHLIKDTTICNYEDDTRTHKIMKGLEQAVKEFDLGTPIWLDTNVRDFKMHSKTRFRADSFVEEIDFDYLEFQVIEEDY